MCSTVQRSWLNAPLAQAGSLSVLTAQTRLGVTTARVEAVLVFGKGRCDPTTPRVLQVEGIEEQVKVVASP